MLSRRHFLQLAGIALAAPLSKAALLEVRHLPALPNAALPAFETTYGRALGSIPVYAAPDVNAPLLKHLWSDTVVPIHDASDDWYRLAQGYVPRHGLQPMIAAPYASLTTAPPFWGTVSGAVAVVRLYCAANAPVIARVGHGGVLRVVDQLPGADNDWYGVADDENSPLLGWVMASLIAPVMLDDAYPSLTLAIEAKSYRLDVYDGADHLLTAPIASGYKLVPGKYPITMRNIGDASSSGHRGIPYALTFGDHFQLTGAYWHNRFGTATFCSPLEVTPPLAQWLYPRAAEIIIS